MSASRYGKPLISVTPCRSQNAIRSGRLPSRTAAGGMASVAPLSSVANTSSTNMSNEQIEYCNITSPGAT